MRSAIPLGTLLLAACSVPLTPPPPPPSGIARIAVEEPRNSTGRDLVMNDAGILAAVLEDSEYTTVPKMLAQDLRHDLERADFEIVEGTPRGTPVLRTEIRRWQPYGADYSHVTVDITASLVEPKDGRTLWSYAREGWTVPTRDSANKYDANVKASRKIAEDLVAGWRARSPTAAP